MKNSKSSSAVCSVCGKPLSDPISVALGIGPICRFTNKIDSHKKKQYDMFNKPKSNYSWSLAQYKGRIFIIIIDLGGPFMTVTNNAENVLKEISKERGLPFTSELVVYRDTCKEFDGLNPHYNLEEPLFYPLRTLEQTEALEKALVWDKERKKKKA